MDARWAWITWGWAWMKTNHNPGRSLDAPGHAGRLALCRVDPPLAPGVKEPDPFRRGKELANGFHRLWTTVSPGAGPVWPLSFDDWDAQMLFFLNRGYRVIAHDRRGHGRSAQVSDGHDMDHYAADAADLAALTAQLDLKNAV